MFIKFRVFYGKNVYPIPIIVFRIYIIIIKKWTATNMFARYLCIVINAQFILALSPGWSAVAQSQLTATSASQVQVILLPQSPE